MSWQAHHPVSSSEMINRGQVDIPDESWGAQAEIVGMQEEDDEMEVVYSEIIPVYDPLSDSTTRFEIEVTDPHGFEKGIVEWTVTLIVPGDVDGPGGDTATATTEIR